MHTFIRDVGACFQWARRFQQQRHRLPDERAVYAWITGSDRLRRPICAASIQEYQRVLSGITPALEQRLPQPQLQLIRQEDTTDHQTWLYGRTNVSGNRWAHPIDGITRFYLDVDPRLAPAIWRTLILHTAASGGELDCKCPHPIQPAAALRRHLQRRELIVVYVEPAHRDVTQQVLAHVWRRFAPAFGQAPNAVARFTPQWLPGISTADDPWLFSSAGKVLTSYHGLVAAVVADEFRTSSEELDAAHDPQWMKERATNIRLMLQAAGMSDASRWPYLGNAHSAALRRIIDRVMGISHSERRMRAFIAALKRDNLQRFVAQYPAP